MFPGEQYPFASFSIDEFSPLIEEILENNMLPENLFESDEDDFNKEDDHKLYKIYESLKNKIWIFFVIFYLIIIIYYRYSVLIYAILFRGNRSKAKFIYLYLRRFLSFERKQYKETLTDYGEKIENKYQIRFLFITELYLKSVFSADFTAFDFELMLKEKKLILGEYKKKISILNRISSFLFPFIRSSK